MTGLCKTKCGPKLARAETFENSQKSMGFWPLLPRITPTAHGLDAFQGSHTKPAKTTIQDFGRSRAGRIRQLNITTNRTGRSRQPNITFGRANFGPQPSDITASLPHHYKPGTTPPFCQTQLYPSRMGPSVTSRGRVYRPLTHGLLSGYGSLLGPLLAPEPQDLGLGRDHVQGIQAL